MTPERWQHVKTVAAGALELAPVDRPAFVARACAADGDLEAEVLSLLAADDPAGRFLEIDLPPGRVGPWRLVREIGRGGMGTVYLAERDDGQFEQRVAVEIVTRGMDSATVVGRFHAERRMLGRLEHPNIARLYDGGVTADGRPFFVMEYLEATPFVAYCRDHRLPVTSRLQLFIGLCEAVDHAHRRLILHRDIKAENVLVDERGHADLLDFGIARLLDADPGLAPPKPVWNAAGEAGPAPPKPVWNAAGEGGSQSAAVTEAGQRVLTPQCGSPEQMRGEPLTTASDVYALGLLLYESLAERPPYELGGLTLAEQTRIVCEQRPNRPSDVAPAAIARRLRGDLDQIVLKAIEKEPARRYAGAADLAGDLRRVLAGRPVTARPAGAVYRGRKFAVRHWRGLVVAIAAAAIVAVAVANALVQGRRAERRFADLRALATTFLFEFHDAIATLPGSTPARELVVARARESLDSLAREAHGDVGLTRELAQAYQRLGDVQGLYYESNLGRIPEARASYEQAIALFTDVARQRRADAGAKADVAQATVRLASTFQASDPARARALLEEALRLLVPVPAKPGTQSQPGEGEPPKPAVQSQPGEGERGGGETDPRVQMAMAMAYTGLAENTSSTTAESLDARNRAIAIFRAARDAGPGNEEAARLLSMSLKRRAALRIGRLKDAAGAADDLAAAATIDEARVARNPANAAARLDLALGESYRAAALRQSGDLDGALAAQERAVALRKQVVEADPRNVRVLTLLLGDYARLAGMLESVGRADAARAAVREGLGLADHIDPAVPVTPDLAAAKKALQASAAR